MRRIEGTNEGYPDENDAAVWCEVCGRMEDHCDCQECETCGEIGSPDCYDQGHLKPMHDSIGSLCDHFGIEPIRSLLRAVDKYNIHHIWLVFHYPVPGHDSERVHYDNREVLDTLKPWMRLKAIGLGGIAWDGSDWEWSDEVPAGGDWNSIIGGLETGFQDALAERDEGVE